MVMNVYMFLTVNKLYSLCAIYTSTGVQQPKPFLNCQIIEDMDRYTYVYIYDSKDTKRKKELNLITRVV